MGHIQFVGRLFENTYRVNRHTHDFWEVVIYTKGSGYVDIADSHLEFKEEDVFVIPPNVPHTDYSEVGFQNYHCNFIDNNFHYTEHKKFRDTENNSFLVTMEQLYYEFNLKRKNYINILNCLYNLLYQYIIVLSEEKEENKYVTFIINEILANFTDPNYNVSETISKIPMTDDYIRKLFFDETGKTPLQYLTSHRIFTAKQLLSLPNQAGLNIREIAWRSGYQDAYYFSRVFKKETGCSPKRWKKDDQSLEEQNIQF